MNQFFFSYPMLNPIVDGFPFYMPRFCGIPVDGMFSISMAAIPWDFPAGTHDRRVNHLKSPSKHMGH